MGNSQAYPVFRTSDAVEAWTQALRLKALLEYHDDRVPLMAEVLTVEDTRRMAAVLPEAKFHCVDPRMDPVTHDVAKFSLAITTAEDYALEPELPLEVLHHVQAGAVEERFVRAVGKGMASIGRGGSRPDDAEAERPGVATYDGVEVVFNGDDVNLSQPAERTRPAASRVSRTPGRS